MMRKLHLLLLLMVAMVCMMAVRLVNLLLSTHLLSLGGLLVRIPLKRIMVRVEQ